MTAADRDAVADIVARVGNFSPAEIGCALELVDIYLANPSQQDYRLLVAADSAGGVCAYACWGPTPMTRGTYDVYWMATRPDAQGQGYGRRLLRWIEHDVSDNGGRIILIETSSKASYAATAEFYRRMGYVEESRIRDFYDTGDDRLVFVKRFC